MEKNTGQKKITKKNPVKEGDKVLDLRDLSWTTVEMVYKSGNHVALKTEMGAEVGVETINLLKLCLIQ